MTEDEIVETGARGITRQSGDLPANAEMKMRAALAALRAAGLALVPVEPTDEMMRAGAHAVDLTGDGDIALLPSDANACYRAMIDTAHPADRRKE